MYIQKTAKLSKECSGQDKRLVNRAAVQRDSCNELAYHRAIILCEILANLLCGLGERGRGHFQSSNQFARSKGFGEMALKSRGFAIGNVC